MLTLTYQYSYHMICHDILLLKLNGIFPFKKYQNPLKKLYLMNKKTWFTNLKNFSENLVHELKEFRRK